MPDARGQSRTAVRGPRMRRRRRAWVAAGVLALAASHGAAQEYSELGPPDAAAVAGAVRAPEAHDHEAVHKELRALRDALVDAVNRRDLDRILTFLHPNVVYTPQDARTLRGPQQIRDYFHRMLDGPDRVVESLTVQPSVDELTLLYADDRTGLAFGGSDDTFRLTNAMDFKLHSRWTATVLKEGDRWLITSFHISANLFDNPVLDLYRGWTWKAGAIGFAAGLVLAGAGAWAVMRRRGTPPVSAPSTTKS